MDDATGSRLEDDSYQPVCTSALDGSDVAVDATNNSGTASSAKKWQWLLREFRVIEYVFAIILYIIARRLGKWMQIHERGYYGCKRYILARF